MQLDEYTLTILKNFSDINPSVYIKPGNVITTIHKSKAVFAKAVVEPTFEKAMVINELQRFIAAYSTFKEPVIDITDKSVVITSSGGTNKINYTQADPNAVWAKPDTNMSLKDVVFRFSMTKDMLKQLDKIVPILGMDEIAFVADGEKFFVRAQKQTRNASDDSYVIELGETDKQFSYVLDVENFKLLQRDYEVSIDSRGFLNFSTDNLDYYVFVKKI